MQALGWIVGIGILAAVIWSQVGPLRKRRYPRDPGKRDGDE
jgi:hypothetical protein